MSHRKQMNTLHALMYIAESDIIGRNMIYHVGLA